MSRAIARDISFYLLHGTVNVTRDTDLDRVDSTASARRSLLTELGIKKVEKMNNKLSN